MNENNEVFKNFGTVELYYAEQDMGFLIDLSTLFGEDRIIPANVTEYPKPIYIE